MTNISIRIHSFITSLFNDIRNERGQDLIEYAMLGGLIAGGIVLVALLFNGAISDMITNIGNCIDFDNTSVCAPGW